MAPNIIATELYTNEPLDAEVVDYAVIKGDKGDKGDTGLTPAFSIGEVTTLDYNQPASANITGTDEAPVLNLGIPKGEDAYTQAVEGGYTGGEEEFNSDLANIKTYAHRAESAEENAETCAANASASASAASDSASSAASAAASASGYAATARDAASDASGYSATASTNATEAAISASSAYSSAVTATQKAADASASATAAAGSASSAYASATAAAGSASSASASATAAGIAQTAAETAQGKAEDAQEAAETAAQSIEESAAQIDTNTADILNLKSALDTKAGIIRDTVNGAVASFVPDASVENLLGVSVDIEPVQAGSGDPSPDNVRPISGWDSVEVKRTGVNVGHIYGYSASNPASPTATLYTSNAYGTTISTTDGSADKIIVTQTDHSATQVINYRNGYISIGCDSLENGKAYWFSAKIKITSNPLNVNSTIALWNGLSGETLNISNGILSGRIGAIESGKRRFLEIRCCGASFELSDVMFTLVETADYHPYQGQSYQIQLGDTVYGGTLDVTTGKLTVDRAMVDLGALTWMYRATDFADWPYFTAPVSGKKNGWNNGIMDAYRLTASQYDRSEDYVFNCSPYYSSGNVNIRDSRYTDAASFKAGVTGVKYCCELSTPITIQLDPVQIATIAGQTNNVWADAGGVSVEFAADLKHYIDSKIAASVAALS